MRPSINYDLKDALLTSTLSIPATASTTVTTETAIDAGQAGGLDNCQLVIECPALAKANAGVTFPVMSCSTPDGTYAATSASVTISTTTATDKATTTRLRVPLDAQRYLKLRAVTGSTARDAAITAEFSLRV